MQYKVNNWKAYNEALKQRGNIFLWIDQESIQNWYYSGPTQRGAQFEYSDDAIKTILAIRQVFRMAFRQTEGFFCSLIQLMKMDINCPDYTVLCRRMKKLNVAIKCSKKITDIVFDGSGLKVFGEGEWKVRQHGVGKRRTWRKIYIGLNPDTKLVELADLTTNSVHDSDAAKQMITSKGIKHIDTFYGDGGFDTWKIYELLDKLGAKAIIPPQRNAKIKRHGNQKQDSLSRDKIIRLIRKVGRKKWKEMSHYHRRSIIENFFFRYKTILGDHLKARKLENQKVEVLLNCEILNKMIRIGTCETIKYQSAA